VWGRLVRILLGFERIKQRGDRFFLDGDFENARHQYERARAALAEPDYRIPTLDALIRECAVRTGAPPAAGPAPFAAEAVSLVPDAARAAGGDLTEFVPNMTDLVELAIAQKPPERAALYRGLGPAFESGYVALVQGDASRAIEQLRLAGRKATGSFVVQLELGRALAMAGEGNAARVELEKAVRLAPYDLEAMCLLAAVHLQLHHYSEAETILLPICEREGSEPEPVFLLGQSLVGQGRQQEALKRFREAVERDSGFHDAYFEAGRLLRRESDADGALRLLVQACSMAPEEVEYNRELAMLVLERDLDVATGLAACDRLMVTDEENRWEYLGWIAELYLRRGWKREAIDPLRKAVDLVPPQRAREKLGLQKRLVELETGLN
jgi:tetratricopeptide (TPR) repeat protein